MSECRLCGNELREGESVIEVAGSMVHHDCADAHVDPQHRKIGLWAAMGSPGQMAIGDVQRDE
jgi:hypothetical protein